MKALLTQPHLFFRLHQGDRQGLYLGFRSLQDMQSKPLGAFWPNSWQPLQLFD
jgi:hypothetical protein